MSRSRNLNFSSCRVSHVGLSVPLFLMLGSLWLFPESLSANDTKPQLNPQLERPQDIPLERLERPLRTAPAPIKPVNLNTASTEQLGTLPGISPALAQQIIEGRPYHARTDLIEKHILSGTAYDRITNLITID